ncbi:glycoside hydrolase family 114 protein [Mycena rosella]|uniref:alpha-galactosidase n=1 Tax=Mycena rosella TaxID=1033263 RepID=A0AAD7DL36_MYCRO|nr:glycoside hydrolase family 114 protein [Mycena rosella]
MFLVALSVGAFGSPLTKRAVTLPPLNGKADYQIGGPYTPASDVLVVTRDNTASPVASKYNICYINAFQTQPDAASFWQSSANAGLLLHKASGALFEDPDWPGEYFLDTRTDANRQAIATIINGWIDSCQAKGFNAIEPDNLDTFTRSNNLLTAADNLALAKLFTDHAHSIGLAVAQKNTGGDLGSTGKSTVGFDFAVAEECQEYEECDSYTDVYGDNIIEIEYTDNGIAAWNSACSARGSSISVIYRDRDVVPSGDSAYHYQEC